MTRTLSVFFLVTSLLSTQVSLAIPQKQTYTLAPICQSNAPYAILQRAQLQLHASYLDRIQNKEKLKYLDKTIVEKVTFDHPDLQDQYFVLVPANSPSIIERFKRLKHPLIDPTNTPPSDSTIKHYSTFLSPAQYKEVFHQEMLFSATSTHEEVAIVGTLVFKEGGNQQLEYFISEDDVDTEVQAFKDLYQRALKSTGTHFNKKLNGIPSQLKKRHLRKLVNLPNIVEARVKETLKNPETVFVKEYTNSILADASENQLILEFCQVLFEEVVLRLHHTDDKLPASKEEKKSYFEREIFSQLFHFEELLKKYREENERAAEETQNELTYKEELKNLVLPGISAIYPLIRRAALDDTPLTPELLKEWLMDPEKEAISEQLSSTVFIYAKNKLIEDMDKTFSSEAKISRFIQKMVEEGIFQSEDAKTMAKNFRSWFQSTKEEVSNTDFHKLKGALNVAMGLVPAVYHSDKNENGDYLSSQVEAVAEYLRQFRGGAPLNMAIFEMVADELIAHSYKALDRAFFENTLMKEHLVVPENASSIPYLAEYFKFPADIFHFTHFLSYLTQLQKDWRTIDSENESPAKINAQKVSLIKELLKSYQDLLEKDFEASQEEDFSLYLDSLALNLVETLDTLDSFPGVANTEIALLLAPWVKKYFKLHEVPTSKHGLMSLTSKISNIKTHFILNFTEGNLERRKIAAGLYTVFGEAMQGFFWIMNENRGKYISVDGNETLIGKDISNQRRIINNGLIDLFTQPNIPEEMEKKILTIFDPSTGEARGNFRAHISQTINKNRKYRAEGAVHPKNSVLVVNSMTPNEFLDTYNEFQINGQNHLRAIIAIEGSEGQHWTHFAKAKGIPVIFPSRQHTGLPVKGMKLFNLNEFLSNSGQNVIVHSDSFEVNPSPNKVHNLREEARLLKIRKAYYDQQAHHDFPGCHKIRGNINPDPDSFEATLFEIEDMEENYIEDIGLFRTEYLYLGEETFNRSRQTYLYTSLANSVEGTVRVRTFDQDIDKPLKALKNMESYIPPKDSNPDSLGIRFALKHARPALKEQLTSLFIANLYAEKHNIEILFPMLSTPEEWKDLQNLIEEVKSDILEAMKGSNEDIEFHPAWIGDLEYISNILNQTKMGAMVENPEAVSNSAFFLSVSSFTSIGFNDLIRYTISNTPLFKDELNEEGMISRDDSKHKRFFSRIDPFVMDQFIQFLKENFIQDDKVCNCGEIASRIELMLFLRGVLSDEEFKKLEKVYSPSMEWQFRNRFVELLRHLESPEIKKAAKIAVRPYLRDFKKAENLSLEEYEKITEQLNSYLRVLKKTLLTKIDDLSQKVHFEKNQESKKSA